MYSRALTPAESRVELTERMLHHFLRNIFSGKVSELCAEKGLPYTLAYNLAHRRINSLSGKDYRLIFGEEPPYQEPTRVDGAFFRRMVRLWRFLNDDVAEADLYREFYQGKKLIKVDYRIFTGKTKTVEVRLEKIMEGKFLEHGFERSEVEGWAKELDEIGDEQRVPYEEIRPILHYLRETLNINPSRILHQWFPRYESDELKTVPQKIYDHALKLKSRAEQAIGSGSKFEVEKLREEIYGKRNGLTLYSEVEEELEFLREYAGRSAKEYLGRSISGYKKSIIRRIAAWRAQKVKDDCDRFIGQRPEIPLRSVPKSLSKKKLMQLISVLKSHITARVIEDKSGTFENAILSPSYYSREEYENEKYGFTSMDKVANTLGMSKEAFDLLVAANSKLFRKIARYDEKWHLPNLYLNELREKRDFVFIKSKYELLASKMGKRPFGY